MDLSAVLISLLLVAVVLLLPLLHGAKRKATAKVPLVLLAGPKSAGKTSLFLRWTTPTAQDLPETVTSVGPSERMLAANPQIMLVDTPGSDKLQQFSRYYLQKGDVKLVVFVLDAAAGADAIRAAARPLMAVLEVAEKRQFPVLIAANKFDQFSTLSVTRVRQLLEAEITQLRTLKSKTVHSSKTTDDSWEPEDFLGLDGKDFEFTDLETDVEIRDGSVRSDRVQKWTELLEDLTN